MAFDSKGLALTSSWQDAFVAPTGAEARISFCVAAGVAAADADAGEVSLRWYSSDADETYVLLEGLAVLRGTQISLLAGELVLSSGDKLEAKANTASKIVLSVAAELI